MSVIALLLAAIVAFTHPTAGTQPDESLRLRASMTPAQRHVVQHLDGALRVLDRRDVSGLSDTQRERRAAAIVLLKAYRDAGAFPLNRDFAGARVPYFIDPVTDVHCAVGHLMAQTGYGALARRIAAADNNVRVLDLRGDAEVEAWLETHGFTLEEAARIQPSYDGGGPIIIPNPDYPMYEPSGSPLNATALGSAMGVSGALFLTQHFTSLGRGSRMLPTANLVLGLATTGLAIAANESTALRAATGAVGIASAISGVTALQGGASSRASARRVQWRFGPTLGGRALYAGANWRF